MNTSCRESVWQGFRRIDYCYKKNEVTLVFPVEKQINQWIWRTEFFGAYPYADIEMLRKGYILAYYSISGLYGSPKAIRKMDDFYNHIIEEYDLYPKVILIGFSRGGLYALNFACEYPERISAIYFDAPVLDIHSWPHGRYSGEGNQILWQECMKAYGYKSEEEAESYTFANKFEPLLRFDIPIIIVAGDCDKSVPYEENGALLEDYYKKNNGHIKVIKKNGAGHHPHSLENPQIIVDFLIKKSI